MKHFLKIIEARSMDDLDRLRREAENAGLTDGPQEYTVNGESQKEGSGGADFRRAIAWELARDRAVSVAARNRMNSGGGFSGRTSLYAQTGPRAREKLERLIEAVELEEDNRRLTAEQEQAYQDGIRL